MEACKAESGKDLARRALRPKEKFREDGGPWRVPKRDQSSQEIWL